MYIYIYMQNNQRSTRCVSLCHERHPKLPVGLPIGSRHCNTWVKQQIIISPVITI